MNLKKIVVAAGSVLFAGSLYAAGEQQGTTASAQELDQDGDGIISKEEAKAHEDSDVIAENWPQIDANDDGQVDVSEFSAFEEKRLPELLQEQENGD
jgi:hypothetical protein